MIVAFGQVLVLELDVVTGAVGEEGALLVGQGPGLFYRAADVQVAAFQALAGRHQAAGADDHFVFDSGAIHDRAAHANQNAVAQGAAMQHDLVADGHLIADDQWKAIRVERASMGDVQHTAVLHAGARPDTDAMHVATHHRQWPHRAVLTDLHIAQHHGRTVDKSARCNFRSVLLKASDGHDSVSHLCR